MIFAVEERIEAPPGVVWRHLTEPVSMSQWMAGIDGIRSRDGGPLKAGSELLFQARGKERTSQVVTFNPERAISLRSVQGGFTATYKYGVRADGAATVVTLEADCVAAGLAKIIAPLLRPMIRKADSGQLAALKKAVETSGG